jgi:hypothetical protein
MNLILIDDPLLDLKVEDFIVKIPSANSGKRKYRLEITLNYPHTKPWLRSSAEHKVMTYYSMFSKMCRYRRHDIAEADARFETTVDGHSHLHGYIDYLLDVNCKYDNLRGLLFDVVHIYLSLLPKRYSHPKKGSIEENYDDYYDRVCIPQCCVTMRLDGERDSDWQKYIAKQDGQLWNENW